RPLLAAPEVVGRLLALLRRPDIPAPVHPTDPDRLKLPRQAPAPLAAVDPQAPAMLMYTSGTTGEAKGVALSHWNMVCAGRAVVEAQAMTSADRVLSSLPLYHINGQCIATVSPVVSGGSIVMPHRFSVSQWWPLVAR